MDAKLPTQDTPRSGAGETGDMTSASWSQRLWLWGPAAAYMLVIFVLSSQSNVPLADKYPDEFLHIVEYAALGLLFCRPFMGKLGALPRIRGMIRAAVCSLGYGVTDELHQSFVPGRDASGMDLLSDLLGTLLGLALFVLAGMYGTRS
jgi:VanZ family protein